MGGGPAQKITVSEEGGPARITLIALRQPQPPAKYIGLNGISKVTNCYRMLHKKKRGGSLRLVMFNLLG